jgi:hypothetical protein
MVTDPPYGVNYGDHDWNLGDAELPGREHPGVARNQTAVLAHQRRRRPAPLFDAGGYRGDLGIRVGAGGALRGWATLLDVIVCFLLVSDGPGFSRLIR